MKHLNSVVVYLLLLLLIFPGCKKSPTGSIKVPKKIERLITGVSLSPVLKNRLSALPIEQQDKLVRVLKDNPRLLTFFDKFPDFIYNWSYLYETLPHKSLDLIFLKSLSHVDDYAKNGGNKLQNYIFKEQGDNVLVYGKTSGRLFATIKPGQVIDIPIDNANNLFTQLKPLGSSRYIIGRARYDTDEIGRIIKSEFPIDELSLKQNSIRDRSVQNNMRKLKNSFDNDHAGHLLGDQFGGSSNMINLVPMSQRVNASLYKQYEMNWKKLASGGKCIDVYITCIYEELSERPSWIKLKYKIDGKDIIDLIENK